jgi:hypothetical protein
MCWFAQRTTLFLMFRSTPHLGYRRPNKGTALLFFPAAGGIANAPFDIRTLHCGEAVSDSAENEKWIAQLWLRQRQYTPTAPSGNYHEKAFHAIGKYCDSIRSNTQRL